MKNLITSLIILLSLNLSAKDLTIDHAANEDLVINEFLASNDATQADQDGEFDDWIELFNNGASSIDLEGFLLSDNGENLAKWSFPAGTSIAPHDYLMIWADDDKDQLGLHTNFKLSGSGETIYLSDAGGNIIDSIEFGTQTTDISYGRFPNGTGSFQIMTPSFNAANIIDDDGDGINADIDCDDTDNTIGAIQAVGTACNDQNGNTQNDQIQSNGCACIGVNPINNGLVINELMASNETTMADQDEEFDDWIELYNNGPTNLDLEGYFLSDNVNNLMKWSIPTGRLIPANGYVVVWADEDGSQEGLHANFKLSASGETIYLVNPAGEIIDLVNFDALNADVGYGRNPNGTGDFQKLTPTFNGENSMTTNIESLLIEPFSLAANPNPTTQSFILEIKEPIPQERSVLIYNLSGIVFFEKSIFKSSSVNTSQWAAGMYIIKVGNSYLKLVVL